MGELIAVYFRRLLLVCVMVIAVIFPDFVEATTSETGIRLNFV